MVTDAIRDYTLKTAREDAMRLARRDKMGYVVMEIRTDVFEARQEVGCLNSYWGHRGPIRERYDRRGDIVANDLNWMAYVGDDPDAIAAHQEFELAKEEARRVQEIRRSNEEAGEASAISRPAEAQTETT